MIGYAYTPLFGTALTPQGSVEALAFVIDRSSPSFAELSDAEAAAIIATGRGELETNLEYFDNWQSTLRCLESRSTFEEIRSELHRS